MIWSIAHYVGDSLHRRCKHCLLSNVNFDVVRKMRDARISALTNTAANKDELARVVDASVRDFLSLAASRQHKSKLNAMDAIGLIKLCRKAAQPSHISQIWPHVQQLSMLPAKDDRTSCALIGSVVSCALEAKDSSTAASVWGFLRSFPHLPMQEASATQLLSALRGQPHIVVEVITALHKGVHGVRARAQHFAVAIQALADAPVECKHVFEMALKRKMVDKVTLVVRCQALQQFKDYDGALNTLSIADALSITPEPAHYTLLLSCAAEMGSIEVTRRIHEHLNKHPTAPSSGIVLCALVKSYAQCGDFEGAEVAFQHSLRHKQVDAIMLVIWCQALQQYKDIAGALNTLAIADSLCITPDAAHYTVLLSCAAKVNSLTATKKIHEHLRTHNSAAANNVGTITALVHNYAQCGNLDTAIAVFEDGLQHGLAFDVMGWTNILSAYAAHGMVKEAQVTLERMVAAGVRPNRITCLCLLNAASHMGLGLGVQQLYQQLQSRFFDLGLESDAKQRACVVDGLARAGLFEEAVAEARELQYDVAWTAVLGAARSHNRLDIGDMAFNELERLGTDMGTLASAHVLMAHIYTANGRDEEAAQMRQFMKDKGLRKLPGESSIEVDGVMHTFRVNDTSHPEMERIVELNDKLHEQLKADGYVPDVVWASRGGVPTQSKEQALCEHSERFALVYGLLHSSEGQPLTIFKNLRVCGDCHNATKHASKVLNRKLTVKDMNRWHVFANGKCSCGDFW